VSSAKFSIKEAISFGWKTFKQNTVFLLMLWFLINLMNLFMGFLGIIEKWLLLSSIITSLLYIVLNIIIGMGLIRIMLKFCDGEKPRFKHLFSDLHLFLKYFLGILLFFFIIIGIVLLGVLMIIISGAFIYVGWSLLPMLKSQLASLILIVFIVAIIIVSGGIGVTLVLRFFFFSYLIIDKELGPVKAFKESWRITKGSVIKLLLFFITLGLINAALSISALIGFGVLLLLSLIIPHALIQGFLVIIILIVGLLTLAIIIPFIITWVSMLATAFVYRKLLPQRKARETSRKKK